MGPRRLLVADVKRYLLLGRSLFFPSKTLPKAGQDPPTWIVLDSVHGWTCSMLLKNQQPKGHIQHDCLLNYQLFCPGVLPGYFVPEFYRDMSRPGSRLSSVLIEFWYHLLSGPPQDKSLIQLWQCVCTRYVTTTAWILWVASFWYDRDMFCLPRVGPLFMGRDCIKNSCYWYRKLPFHLLQPGLEHTAG